MRAPNPKNRPKVKEVLAHPFFQHDYVSIVRFLTDLPLKTEGEKRQFFGGLVRRLFELPQDSLAVQLAPLLLSRYVLLDPTARHKLLPSLLTPAQSKDSLVLSFSAFLQF